MSTGTILKVRNKATFRAWARAIGFVVTVGGVIALYTGSVQLIMKPPTDVKESVLLGFIAAAMGAISIIYRGFVDLFTAGSGRLSGSALVLVFAIALAIVGSVYLNSFEGVDTWPTAWMWIGFIATLLPPVLEDASDRLALGRDS